MLLLVALAAAGAGACRSSIGPDNQSDCTFAVSGDSTSNIPAAGATLTFKITTQSGCMWRTTTSSDFVQFSAASGSGTTILTLTVTPNAYGVRNTSLHIMSWGASLNQLAGGVNPPGTTQSCEFAVSPGRVAFPSAGGRATFTFSPLNALGRVCEWSAAADDPFVTIVAPASGLGSGQVTIEAPANSGAIRVTQLKLANRTIEVAQDGPQGCVWSAGPSPLFIQAEGAYYYGLRVDAPASCRWAALSMDDFVEVYVNDFTGPQDFSVFVQPNTRPVARTGTLRMGGATVTINQRAATP